jgi:hypothetical protein
MITYLIDCHQNCNCEMCVLRMLENSSDKKMHILLVKKERIKRVYLCQLIRTDEVFNTRMVGRNKKHHLDNT